VAAAGVDLGVEVQGDEIVVIRSCAFKGHENSRMILDLPSKAHN